MNLEPRAVVHHSNRSYAAGVSAWRAWLAYRWRETLVWIGIPVVGLLTAARPGLELLGLFAAAAFAFL